MRGCVGMCVCGLGGELDTATTLTPVDPEVDELIKEKKKEEHKKNTNGWVRSGLQI